MHRTTTVSSASNKLALPRGWIIAIAALLAWGLFAGLVFGAALLLSFVFSAI